MKINNVFKSINKRIDKTVKTFIGAGQLKPVARDIAKQIRVRTRLGKGVSNGKRGGQSTKLKTIASSTKKSRKRLKNTGKLSSLTSPNRSNLTATAQLLDAIEGSAVNNQMNIFFKEGRNDGALNKKIKGYQHEMGRHFFELTKKELTGIRRELKESLLKILRKNNR